MSIRKKHSQTYHLSALNRNSLAMCDIFSSAGTLWRILAVNSCVPCLARKHVLHPAVLAHVQASPRFVRLKHPMPFELLLHHVQHRSGRERLAAGNTTEWLLLVKRARLVSCLAVEQVSRRPLNSVLGTGFFAQTALHATRLGKIELRQPGTIPQRIDRTDVDAPHTQGTGVPVNPYIAKRRTCRQLRLLALWAGLGEQMIDGQTNHRAFFVRRRKRRRPRQWRHWQTGLQNRETG